MPHVLTVCAVTAALVAFASTAGFGQSAATKEQAAREATRKAQAVTLQDVGGHGTIGTLELQRIGATRTRVVLHVPGGTAPKTLELRKGTDCSTNEHAARLATIPLNRVNDRHISETIVDVPLDQLQSGDYLVAVRNATQRQQFYQACARVARHP